MIATGIADGAVGPLSLLICALVVQGLQGTITITIAIDAAKLVVMVDSYDSASAVDVVRPPSSSNVS